MTQFVLATGMDDLDAALKQPLTDMMFEVTPVSYLQALSIIPTNPNDVVLLSDAIPTSGVGLNSAIDVVDGLRRHEVRVIFIGASRPREDELVPAFISRGVYDILLSDDLLLTDILHVIRNPATYADVAHWMRDRKQVGGSLDLPEIRSIRPSLKWRTAEEVEREAESREDVGKQSSGEERSLKWFRRSRSSDGKTSQEGHVNPRIVTVTGLPGAGTSFIALHLACVLAQKHQVTLIEASTRPILARWLNGPPEDRGAQQLAAKKATERRWMFTDNLRIVPSHPEETGPNVVLVREAANELDTDIVVIDAALEDVRRESVATDVLVITPDVVKTRHVRDIRTRLVVVNMAPRLLPVDLAEYGRSWAPVSVTSCPYFAEQALAVVTGQLVGGMSEVIKDWTDILID